MDDAARAVRVLPAQECAKCGHVSPDADQVLEMPRSEVPSSVRLRCIKAVLSEESELPRSLDDRGGPSGPRPPGVGVARHSVLLVDDDPDVARPIQRMLRSAAYEVCVVLDGPTAIEAVRRQSFDVVVSDIFMPGMTGLSLLRAIRSHDLDVPVILTTGNPTVETAIEAVALGAMQYLAKPVRDKELLGVVEKATKLHRLTKLKREALDLLGASGFEAGDRAGLHATLDRALAAMWVAFQPIVLSTERRVFGYEALLRTDEPLMKSPADILEAAERLGRLHELGRTIRAKVALAAPGCPPEAKLFVNLHAADLNDEELYSPDSLLSKLAARVVLEVTERASLDHVSQMESRVARLKALGYQIAVDDLGAGYAGLTSFTQLEPNIAKLDMSLVRGVDTDSRRQSIIRSMKSLCDELGVTVIAEGVETPEERAMLVQIGCNVLQGYLFAKPSRTFGPVVWV
jgi:EAL domain-containing protein (putative c-di-GMP-specific phosphodiesterase class I)/ActR/RegA family two-component response regulator